MLNFMKGSLFSREKTEALPEEPEQDVQVLAVWGSPGSGKTTVSVRLAKYLAEHKKNVALLLCDMTVNPMQHGKNQLSRSWRNQARLWLCV